MNNNDLTDEQILQAYLDTFATPSGEIVLIDMEEAFIKRMNISLEENMQEFEHPYRAYVEIGQRMVVQNIQVAIEIARGKKDE